MDRGREVETKGGRERRREEGIEGRVGGKEEGR